MIEVFLFIFLFVIGSALGSFGSVVVERMNRDESFILGRSYCEKCRHVLSANDLIPLILIFLLEVSVGIVRRISQLICLLMKYCLV